MNKTNGVKHGNKRISFVSWLSGYEWNERTAFNLLDRPAVLWSAHRPP